MSLGNNGTVPYAVAMAVTPGSLVLDYSAARLNDALVSQLRPTAVCRYLLDDARNISKALHPDETRWLAARGIPIVGNFEYATSPNLTADQGATDAGIAQAEIIRNRLPSDSPIVFSMDRDLFISEIPAVLRYWSGAQGVLGMGRGLDGQSYPRAGLYGEFDLIEAAGRAGVHWNWQASAWSRGLLSKYARVHQVWNDFIPGFDKNIAQAADIGQRFPTGYGDIDVNLSDRIVVGDRYKQFPPELNVTAKTEFTVEELLLQGVYRPAQAVSMIRAADTGDQARDGAEAQSIANLAALIKGGSGAIDVPALAQQLLSVLAPAQAIALSDVLRKTHLTVDGS